MHQAGAIFLKREVILGFATMGSQMWKYGWPAIFVRDGAVLLFACTFSFLATDNTNDSGFTVPLQPPCSNAGWQEIILFILLLSLAIALVEGLNWVGWLLRRNPVLRSDPVASQTETDPLYGVDMLLPKGWIGLALGLGLLFTAYVLHGPSPCVSIVNSTSPERYFAGALALAYGLLLLTQGCFDLAWKFTAARSK